MRPIVLALLIITFVLSACAGGASQEIDPQSQAPAPKPVPPSTRQINRSPVLYTSSQGLWGGFEFSETQTAEGLWGGSQLHSTFTDNSSPSSFTPPCETTQDFCVLQHYYPFLQPFSAEFNSAVDPSYRYGSTQFGVHAPHHGVEMYNPTGTPVIAVADGIVVVAGTDARSEYGPWENFYGNLVVLSHQLPDIEEQVFTLYGHLSEVKVQAGQSVNTGDLIGEVGATGMAIGSHLHFEVRVGTNNYTDTRNPELWVFPHRDENNQLLGTLAGVFANSKGYPIHLTTKAQYYSDIDGNPEHTYLIETYAPDKKPVRGDDKYRENFVLNDLPPGYYRIVYVTAKTWTERWVEVEFGKLTFVPIVIN